MYCPMGTIRMITIQLHIHLLSWQLLLLLPINGYSVCILTNWVRYNNKAFSSLYIPVFCDRIPYGRNASLPILLFSTCYPRLGCIIWHFPSFWLLAWIWFGPFIWVKVVVLFDKLSLVVFDKIRLFRLQQERWAKDRHLNITSISSKFVHGRFLLWILLLYLQQGWSVDCSGVKWIFLIMYFLLVLFR